MFAAHWAFQQNWYIGKAWLEAAEYGARWPLLEVFNQFGLRTRSAWRLPGRTITIAPFRSVRNRAPVSFGILSLICVGNGESKPTGTTAPWTIIGVAPGGAGGSLIKSRTSWISSRVRTKVPTGASPAPPRLRASLDTCACKRAPVSAEVEARCSARASWSLRAANSRRVVSSSRLRASIWVMTQTEPAATNKRQMHRKAKRAALAPTAERIFDWGVSDAGSKFARSLALDDGCYHRLSFICFG